MGGSSSLNTHTMTNVMSEHIYFILRCDDLRKPSDVYHDSYFVISDFDSVAELKGRLDSLGCRYDLLIQQFDSVNDDVISNDYIVRNNYLNS